MQTALHSASERNGTGLPIVVTGSRCDGPLLSMRSNEWWWMMFFTNNSPDLCVLTLCINKFRQNNLYLAPLPRISANSNENYIWYNFQSLANICGNFPEILNFQKIYSPSCWPWVSLNECLVPARNTYIRQQTECMHPIAIALWLPEQFFEQSEAESEVRLLLPELFPGSCGAPRAAVAVPCTRITVHKFCSVTILRCYSGVRKYDLCTEKLQKDYVTRNCLSGKNVIKHTLCFSQKRK